MTLRLGTKRLPRLARAWLYASAMMLFLPGCTSMVVGGAAEGGYATANDGRSASQATDDAGITSAINTRFVRDELVRAVEIRVETRQGVVTLTGVVDSPKASLRAQQLARSTPGVRRVDSRLRVRQ
jgi:hyperosmotically inducible protein